jgi:hypothetical protein
MGGDDEALDDQPIPDYRQENGAYSSTMCYIRYDKTSTNLSNHYIEFSMFIPVHLSRYRYLEYTSHISTHHNLVRSYQRLKELLTTSVYAWFMW